MSNKKPWDRAWSMDEVIDNADNWSLAGDVALLNYLKEFSNGLIARTGEINDSVRKLTDGLDETALRLSVARNEFQSLRNVQFIESRVYEDDETLPQPSDNGVDEKGGDKEVDRSEDVRLAVAKGLEVLDKYFDKVQLDVSDSEDDNDMPSYVLRPRDPYVERPLPYVIGSEEWHKHWHVGLADSSSDSETEKNSDNFSETDSESDLPTNKTSQIKGTSGTSSELDFSNRSKPAASASATPKADAFASSDSEDQNSAPAEAPVSNRSFAEDLAAKLGSVIGQEHAEPEVNRRPIQAGRPRSQYGDLFFDEPPPLEDGKEKGLFSGGAGLFDDDGEDESDFWGRKPGATGSKPQERSKSPQKSVQRIFDGDSSDDDIFNPQKPQPFKSNKPPLFVEEPPTLEQKKKPVGGVSIFGGSNLFDERLLRNRLASDEEEERDRKAPEISSPKKRIDLFDDSLDSLTGEPDEINEGRGKANEAGLFGFATAERGREEEAKIVLDREENQSGRVVKDDDVGGRKKISLFDDDSLFSDDLFSGVATKKFTSGLFDETNDGLFAEIKNESDGLFGGLTTPSNDKNSIKGDPEPEDTRKSRSPGPAAVFVPELPENAAADFFDEPQDRETYKTKTHSVGLFDSESDDDGFFASERGGSYGIASKPSARSPALFDSPPPIEEFAHSHKSDAKALQKFSPDFTASAVEKSTDGIFEKPTPAQNDTFFSSTISGDDLLKKNETSSHPIQRLDAAQDKTGGSFEKEEASGAESEPASKLSAVSPKTDRNVSGGPKDVEPEIPPLDPKPPSVSLFDPTPPPDDDDWSTRSDNSDDPEPFLGPADEPKLNLFDDEPPLLPPDQTTIATNSAPTEYNISDGGTDFPKKKDSVASVAEKMIKNEPVWPKPKPGVPGKLKHNLNINVGALIPGCAPPKHRQQGAEENREVHVPDDNFVATDDGQVQVLHSVTKDRARVPLRRRPSTRRGRKTALRNSASEFKLDQDEAGGADGENVPPETQNTFEYVTATSPSAIATEVIDTFSSTDLFDEPAADAFTSPLQHQESGGKSSLFDSPPGHEDLFDVASSRPVSGSQKPFLSDDDDDLFSGKASTKILKKSLFDDDDLDDDIFKSSAVSGVARRPATKFSADRIPRKSGLRKLENTKPEDDPLSALLKR